METKKFLSFFKVATVAAAMFAGASFISSCSDDDDDDLPIQDVPADVHDTFSKQFPGATKVEWERKGDYFVADCVYNYLDSDMWYESTGKWVMTEVDYEMNMTLTPQAVQNAYSASEYAQGVLDDITYYQRIADEFYEIETVLPGDKEYTLFYNADGTLIKSILNFRGEIYPFTVVSAL